MKRIVHQLKLISIMKKQMLSFALVATMIGSIAAGCSSEKKAGSGTDSTSTDSSSMMAKPDSSAMQDTSKADTTTRDTSKKVPQ
ncbi:hypothetical protein A0256_17205 [Mucilaginibacter sp. PAMC 26640]|nr:hypothetical protein A0256_17205 [Mucilaginibacter sp. PAMC 26640]